MRKLQLWTVRIRDRVRVRDRDSPIGIGLGLVVAIGIVLQLASSGVRIGRHSNCALRSANNPTL